MPFEVVVAVEGLRILVRLYVGRRKIRFKGAENVLGGRFMNEHDCDVDGGL